MKCDSPDGGEDDEQTGFGLGEISKLYQAQDVFLHGALLIDRVYHVSTSQMGLNNTRII